MKKILMAAAICTILGYSTASWAITPPTPYFLMVEDGDSNQSWYFSGDMIQVTSSWYLYEYELRLCPDEWPTGSTRVYGGAWAYDSSYSANYNYWGSQYGHNWTTWQASRGSSGTYLWIDADGDLIDTIYLDTEERAVEFQTVYYGYYYRMRVYFVNKGSGHPDC